MVHVFVTHCKYWLIYVTLPVSYYNIQVRCCHNSIFTSFKLFWKLICWKPEIVIYTTRVETSTNFLKLLDNNIQIWTYFPHSLYNTILAHFHTYLLSQYVFVENNDSLEDLDLSWNQLRLAGARAIGNSLQVFCISPFHLNKINQTTPTKDGSIRPSPLTSLVVVYDPRSFSFMCVFCCFCLLVFILVLFCYFCCCCFLFYFYNFVLFCLSSFCVWYPMLPMFLDCSFFIVCFL